MFTQYCLWLETQGVGVALGQEHLPTVGPPSPPPNLAPQTGARSSAFSNPDNLFSPHLDLDGDDALGTFAPFGPAAPTSNDPSSSNTACSDKDEAMLDLLLDDFAATAATDTDTTTSDGFSGFLPELRDLHAILPNKSSSSSSSISDGHTQQQWTAQDQVCHNTGTCCFALASKTLKSLHVPSTACLSTVGKASFTSRSRPTAPRTAGSVLAGNREAMLALSTMLRCSCSLKVQLQLVMATICDKLVTWYHAMVQSEQSAAGFPTSSSSSATASTTTNPKLRGWAGNGRGKERVLCQPITIGDYSLDGAAAAQITGRVVLARLQGMDILVLALLRRIKDVDLKSSSSRHGGEQQQQQHSSSPPSGEADLLGIMRDRLVAYLVGKLQRAREEAVRLMSFE
jgi:Aflatoxin regulatory protein